MNVNLVLVISIVLITAAVLFLIAYTIMLLSHVRKILAPVEKMMSALGDEFKPLLNDLSGIASSLNNFLGRFDRITGLVFGKADMMAQGAEKVSSYARKFISNPRMEISGIGAGLKKGIEVLFRSKKKEG